MPATELIEAFDVPDLSFEWAARYNIAPSQLAPVVAQDSSGRRMGLLSWGLIPRWMDRPGSGFINARAESISNRRSFGEAFARRRCLVPADGFYEWRAEGSGGTKQPFWIHPVNGGVCSFAGLWDSWRRPGDEPRHTFTVVTTEASPDVAHVHDRMPVVIDEAGRSAWLDPESDSASLHALLRPAAVGTFVSHPVSVRVNRPVEDDPLLIEPIEL